MNKCAHVKVCVFVYCIYVCVSEGVLWEEVVLAPCFDLIVYHNKGRGANQWGRDKRGRKGTVQVLLQVIDMFAWLMTQWERSGRQMTIAWSGNPNLWSMFVSRSLCVLPSFSGSRVIAMLSLPLPRLTRWGMSVWTLRPFPVSIRSRGGDYKHQSEWKGQFHNLWS